MSSRQIAATIGPAEAPTLQNEFATENAMALITSGERFSRLEILLASAGRIRAFWCIVRTTS